jgi:PAT family beta-lactamase induction signal transducer AmpG
MIAQRLNSWLGVYLQKRLLIIALLGFSSGIPLFLTSSTLTIWLKELGYGYATIGYFAIATLPYSFRFVWAPLIDRMPLPFFTKTFGRRRGWLISSQISLMACLVAFNFLGPSIELTFLTTFCAATQETVLLTYQMESLTQKEFGPGDAIGVFGARIAMLISGAGAIYMSTFIPWGIVYVIMAVCVSVGLITTLCMAEPQPVISKESQLQEKKIAEYLHTHPRLKPKTAAALSWGYAAIVCPFTDFMKQRGWLAALGVMLIYKFGDDFLGTMPNIMYMELGFSKAEIAQATKLFGIAASMLGGLIGGLVVVKMGFFRSLFYCGIFHLLATFMYIVTYYKGHDMTMLYIAIGLEHITGGMRTTALFSYQLVLCNPVYAATQLALLTSLVNLGRTLFASTSGLAVEQFGWVNFYNIAIIGSLPSLLLVIYMMKLSGESLFNRRPVYQVT